MTFESDDLERASLRFHEQPYAGKYRIRPKSINHVRDLAYAYSPGVAFACEHIVRNKDDAYRYTNKGNTVAVISNGSAVLGLGNIGALAGKPVMEGKAILFKMFADIDAVDVNINAHSVDDLEFIVAALSCGYGGINLEDIKAPECFTLEERLVNRLDIPVFHDDQHGTAVVASAALRNALTLTNKNIESVQCVVSGSGAAAMACLDLWISMGMPKENITIFDSKGCVHHNREDYDSNQVARHKKWNYACTKNLSLEESLRGADVFLGLSVGDIVSCDMVKNMAPKPIILAMANPIPEIMPSDVQSVRSDAIVATGRSDFPNQVNNLLCFPYIFRAALDQRASTINHEMKKACVDVLCRLTLEAVDDYTKEFYAHDPHLSWEFGPSYLIPRPFDHRLRIRVPHAVAKAAALSGVTRYDYDDVTYQSVLEKRFSHSLLSGH